jgi:hypothetical protein
MLVGSCGVRSSRLPIKLRSSSLGGERRHAFCRHPSSVQELNVRTWPVCWARNWRPFSGARACVNPAVGRGRVAAMAPTEGGNLDARCVVPRAGVNAHARPTTRDRSPRRHRVRLINWINNYLFVDDDPFGGPSIQSGRPCSETGQQRCLQHSKSSQSF